MFLSGVVVAKKVRTSALPPASALPFFFRGIGCGTKEGSENFLVLYFLSFRVPIFFFGVYASICNKNIFPLENKLSQMLQSGKRRGGAPVVLPHVPVVRGGAPVVLPHVPVVRGGAPVAPNSCQRLSINDSYLCMRRLKYLGPRTVEFKLHSPYELPGQIVHVSNNFIQTEYGGVRVGFPN